MLIADGAIRAEHIKPGRITTEQLVVGARELVAVEDELVGVFEPLTPTRLALGVLDKQIGAMRP